MAFPLAWISSPVFLLLGLFFDHPLGLFLHVVCLILMGFLLTGFSIHLCRGSVFFESLIEDFLAFFWISAFIVQLVLL